MIVSETDVTFLFRAFEMKVGEKEKKLQNIQLYGEKKGFYSFPQCISVSTIRLAKPLTFVYERFCESVYLYFNRFLMHPTFSNEGVKKWKTKTIFFLSVRSFC